MTGAEEFARLSKRFKDAGEKELRKELYASVQRATKPAKEAARQAAASELPSRGGLADKVAKAKLTTKARAGRDPSVRIVAKSDLDLRAIDNGTLRHPVYGNRNRWVSQSIPAGWFTDAMRRSAPKVRRELTEAMRRVAAQITSK